MSLDAIYNDVKERMQKSVDHVKYELTRIRTGRATPALLDGVKVDYYGSPTPLNQIGTVAAPEPRLLTVTPYEKRIIADIEKAIMTADLGLNPANDGNIIRIPIPELSEERRQDLLKLVKKHCEDGRIAIRNVRRDANDSAKKLEKDHDISEDQMHDAQGEIQKFTDDYIKSIDTMMANKETELLGE